MLSSPIGILNGVKIMVVPVRYIAKVQLSRNCPCSDEMLFSTNLWLEEMFGLTDRSILPKGQTLFSEITNTWHIREDDYERVKQQLEARK